MDMTKDNYSLNLEVERLKEREKELRCIYEISEILNDYSLPIGKQLNRLISVIPSGWQYPGICKVQICFENIIVQSKGFVETEWAQQADLVIDNHISGLIKICYKFETSPLNNKPFLEEEQKLLQSIAELVSASFFYRKLKTTINFLKGHANLAKIPEDVNSLLRATSDMHSKWRMRMALALAENLDLEIFGITGIYLGGNIIEATSGPGSCLELLVHFHGSEIQKQLLISWIEGWSFGLGEFNFAHTGYRVENLIDLHIISDSDFNHPEIYTTKLISDSQAILLKGSKPAGIL
jgi:hypothetical protein